MKYKASKDTTVIVMNTIACLIVVVSGYFSIMGLINSQGKLSIVLMHSTILLLMIGIILFAYLFAPRAYSITENYLIIHRPISNKVFSLQSIDDIRQINKNEMKVLIQTLGITSVLGKYSRNYSHHFGNVMFYATKRDNYVLISFNNTKKILITPDELSIIDYLLEQKRIGIKRWFKSSWG